ncbi:MAG TPA: hypothetical protein VF631_13215 [Allosphingosinicella sp.]|uniref:hypothetical protein n=1 Tax=Allosphingosinicella sp. TaxID=2823234 RepID=UPI002F28EFD0
MISKQIEYIDIDNLLLDPQNPRIGRRNRLQPKSQDALLKLMIPWTLDELVDSFLKAGGFWTQDALIAITSSDETGKLVVVEGNRRLAALKLMRSAVRGEIEPPKWLRERLSGTNVKEDAEFFTSVPYLMAETREDVDAYLGFRHVSGIKEWAPTEKAEFMTRLIDEENSTFRDVAKQIGTRADIVKQNYVAYKILLQMENELDPEEWQEVEEKFSVLFLSLRSAGVRHFLGIDLRNLNEGTHDPIPESHRGNVREYIAWLFGTKKSGPLVKDSRHVDRFGEILAEPKAVEYLRSQDEPQLEYAYAYTKASVDLVAEPLKEAARSIRLALRAIPGREDDEILQEEAWPVTEGGIKLALVFNGAYQARAQELLGAA